MITGLKSSLVFFEESEEFSSSKVLRSWFFFFLLILKSKLLIDLAVADFLMILVEEDFAAGIDIAC